MKYVVILVLCLILVTKSNCQIPNVFEFCTALLSDRNPSLCGSCQQGRPGKRGGEGRRGPVGPKGDKGDDGTCETLENKVNALKDFTIGMMKKLSAEPLAGVCGLGMMSNAIPDSAVTASSQWSSSYAGYEGRIGHSTYWITRTNSLGQWIQVDLGTPKSISGVVTQGRPGSTQWVKSFKIFCGDQTNKLFAITENGSEKVFTANINDNVEVVNIFPTPVVCRYFRLYPVTWNSHISMRMELLSGDCFEVY